MRNIAMLGGKVHIFQVGFMGARGHYFASKFKSQKKKAIIRGEFQRVGILLFKIKNASFSNNSNPDFLNFDFILPSYKPFKTNFGSSISTNAL